LESAWARDTAAGHFAYWMGVVVALMTAFYSWRLLWMTFHGQPRASHDVMHHIHESPFVMLLPLCVLAGGAIFSGWYFYDSFVGHHYLENFWHDSLFVLASNDSVSAAHDVALWVKKLPLVMAGSGIVLACIMYGALPGSSARMRQIFYAPYLLFYNKWWFDEIYDRVFVRTAFALGRVFFSLWRQEDHRRAGPRRLSLGIQVGCRFAEPLSDRLHFSLCIGHDGGPDWFIDMVCVSAILEWFWNKEFFS
jgi:NADH-quinone oxidoreductase subunit L